jgi:hypothetical protein
MKITLRKIVIGLAILVPLFFFAARYAYAEWNDNHSDSQTLVEIGRGLNKIADQLERINYHLDHIEETFKEHR